MAVRFYDTAIVEKLKHWVKDPNLRILKPEEATRFFEMTFDETKDQSLKLPLISISRDKNIEILNSQKQPKTYSGFSHTLNEKISIPINVIPIQISYQIDIYTKGMEEADEYVRNFVFNFINYPRLKINIPYNDTNIEHVSNISLDPEIIDNSDIKEHLFADEFVRFTLKITIDDAYLFSLPVNSSSSFEMEELEVEYKDRETHEIVETDKIL